MSRKSKLNEICAVHGTPRLLRLVSKGDSHRPESYCDGCRRDYYKSKAEQLKEYRRSKTSTPEGKKKEKDSQLRNKYGITLEEYNRLFTEQTGRCRICATHQSELTRALAVDHCHSTGKVRGLLCSKCNTALGNFKDDVALLLKAADYLKAQS